ncbi:hypothetical protein [Azoarcus sp. KH32C]|uniref:hypothetical protein n=1 Tax=Azoarcus sp. KH32C TaxID=748247 RepID=UPI0002386BFE|nr:hypothetical protein [Azoarcus sp. KH32C]BAL22746.1 hypothetical protein AZKH_0400 [Azoarcus sp. KH32C]
MAQAPTPASRKRSVICFGALVEPTAITTLAVTATASNASILAFTDERNIVCLDENRTVGDTLSVGRPLIPFGVRQSGQEALF